MTSTKYYLCRFARIFGYYRKSIRMGEASSEALLLKEAEIQLGIRLWKKVEHIEELSVEYWNLRKLEEERKSIAEEFETCQQTLNQAHEERNRLIGTDDAIHQELSADKDNALDALESLIRENEQILAQARETKRNYNGLKLKQEVLNRDGDQNPEKLDEISKKLESIKAEFEGLKAERQSLAEKIKAKEEQISNIKKKISERKAERNNRAAEAFQHIGEENQNVSTLRTKLGAIDAQMRQMQLEVGRHLSRHAHRDASCRKACRTSRGLVDVMRALRKSIHYNQQLAQMV